MLVKRMIAFISFVLLLAQTGQAGKIKLPVVSGYYVEQTSPEVCKLPDEEFSFNNHVLMFDADDGTMGEIESICKAKKIFLTPDKKYHITWQCDDVGERYNQSMELKILPHTVLIDGIEYMRCERNQDGTL